MAPAADDVPAKGDELPVVARMVVEIRSDGTRTVARGALDDRVADQKVALEIEAGSLLSLTKSLAKAMLDVPSLARLAVRGSWRKATRRLPPRLRGSKDPNFDE